MDESNRWEWMVGVDGSGSTIGGRDGSAWELGLTQSIWRNCFKHFLKVR